MTEHVASEALRRIGPHDGVRPLASGMSSQAWIGSVDRRRWVVRVPVGDGRRPTPDYRAESALLLAAAERGVPVAASTIIEVDGVACSVAPERPGRPVVADDWDEVLVGDVAAALRRLHSLDPSLAVEHDIVARFHLATIWPFDDTDLRAHPVATRWPELIGPLLEHRDRILEAGSAPATVVHSDLHADHLLVDGGRLTGLLDLGDTFPGPAEWDIACLRFYHRDITDRVVAAGDRWDPERARLLTIPFVLYKLAKQPERAVVVERVEPILRASLA